MSTKKQIKRITIPAPHVPFGPAGIPEHLADADYLRNAASNLRFAKTRDNVPFGSNLTNTVVDLLDDVADALVASEPTPPVWTGPADLTALDHPDFPGLLDSDGYPTSAALAVIARWTGTPCDLVEEVLKPIFAPGGSITCNETTDHFDRNVIEVRVVTGGWSGCESTLGALERGLFWFCWWDSSHRGGLHVFVVPLHAQSEQHYGWTTPLRLAADWPGLDDPIERAYRAGLESERRRAR